MNPLDPLDAQQIVAEYARVLERDLNEHRHPARVDSLPYGKPIIQSAIKTSVISLSTSGQLTDELREFLETAYILLADYLDADLVRLMSEYRESAAELAADPRLAREKTTTAAWRTISESGSLAGEVARAMALEADSLRAEFRAVVDDRASV
jgi:hypothetical protein